MPDEKKDLIVPLQRDVVNVSKPESVEKLDRPVYESVVISPLHF